MSTTFDTLPPPDPAPLDVFDSMAASIHHAAMGEHADKAHIDHEMGMHRFDVDQDLVHADEFTRRHAVQLYATILGLNVVVRP